MARIAGIRSSPTLVGVKTGQRRSNQVAKGENKGKDVARSKVGVGMLQAKGLYRILSRGVSADPLGTPRQCRILRGVYPPSIEVQVSSGPPAN